MCCSRRLRRDLTHSRYHFTRLNGTYRHARLASKREMMDQRFRDFRVKARASAIHFDQWHPRRRHRSRINQSLYDPACKRCFDNSIAKGDIGIGDICPRTNDGCTGSGEIGFANKHLLECGIGCRNTCFGLSDSGPSGYDALRGCTTVLLSCPFFKQCKLLPRDIALCRSLLKRD